jgi:hypothetical protein
VKRGANDEYAESADLWPVWCNTELPVRLRVDRDRRLACPAEARSHVTRAKAGIPNGTRGDVWGRFDPD